MNIKMDVKHDFNIKHTILFQKFSFQDTSIANSIGKGALASALTAIAAW